MPRGSKRQALDVQFKKQVLKGYLADKNRSLQDAATEFGLKLNTVKGFYRNRDVILATNDCRKKMRSAEHPELEADVLKFVHVARSLRLPVCGNVIQIKAQSLRSK